MRSVFCCDVMVFSRGYRSGGGIFGGETVEQAAATIAPVVDAKERQRLPNYRLIAGYHRAAELLLDLLDDREHRNVGAAEEINIGIGPPRHRAAPREV